MILFIKNMVCLRCQMVVRYEVEKLGLNCISVEAGQANVSEPISKEQIHLLKIALTNSGLELIENKKIILVEKIVHVIMSMLERSDELSKINFSHYLSTTLNFDYTYLANIFTEVKGITIERFMIVNRIQRVKQLICHQELNLTEISWKLNYSSVAHLSTQFKKVTGVTPSYFRHIQCNTALLPEMCEL